MMKFRSLTLATMLLAPALSLSAQNHDSALELNGINQYLYIKSHPDFDISRQGSYTITAWFNGFRTITYGPAQRIVSRRSEDKDAIDKTGYELFVLRNTAKGLSGGLLSDDKGKGLELWAEGNTSSELRSWHHLAFVVDRAKASVTLYLDGKVQTTRPLDQLKDWDTANGLPLYIGAMLREGKPTAFFGGLIDNIRFYRRALSLSDLKQDAESEDANLQDSSLVAAYDFSDYIPGQQIATDKRGNHPAYLINFPTALNHPQILTYSEHPTNATLVGRGNLQAVGEINLGLKESKQLESITLNLSGTSNLKDVDRLALYLTDNGDRFDPRSAGQLVAEGKKPVDSLLTLRSVKNSPALNKHSKLWLVADINKKAKEGNKLTVQVSAIQLTGGVESFKPLQPTRFEHDIVLQRTLIWAPGEANSAHYRIPGIIRLNDGSLVASIDKRKNSEFDLPEDINVEVKISKDNGRSWSKPITVAEGKPDFGYGDAAMATDGKNIYMVMVAGSGLWNYPSHAKTPLQMFATQSRDGGKTWDPVHEISKEVYTNRFSNGGFFGSGNGIVTSKGRIAFVAAMRVNEKWGGQMDNVMVYSDDQGKTWHSSPVARTNGDEAKVIELSDGRLLISSRNRGYAPRTYVISADNGQTWSEPKGWPELLGNAVNQGIHRYPGGNDGEDLMLHTLLDDRSRRNLKLLLSTDGGKTWTKERTICRNEAVYSEIVILKDGTIGIISEEDDRPGFDIYFTQLSLDWLRHGDDVKIHDIKASR